VIAILAASVSFPNPLSETTTDNPMRFYDKDIRLHGRTWPSCHSAPDRTVVPVAAMDCLQVRLLLAQL